MMWDQGLGAGWMVLWMAMFWGGVILVSVWGVRRFRRNSRHGTSSALEILEERYARGEVDREEFESRGHDLRS